MATAKDFTPEQWAAIKAARTRLAAYINKAQPYPSYPDDEQISAGLTSSTAQIIPVKAIPRGGMTVPQSQPRYDSLLGELRHLEKELHQHIDTGKKNKELPF